MDPIQREDFERAIGKLAINWAAAEHAFDHCLSILFYEKGASSLTTVLPLNARAKVKFFQKAVKAIPELADAFPRAEELANAAFKILDDRNWCIHGTTSMIGGTLFDQPFNLSRFERPGMEFIENKTVTMDFVGKTSEACAKLTLALAVFAFRKFGIFSKDEVEDALRGVREDITF
ncbi:MULTISPECIES: hypothetical protein [unclassified Mesorhizobium]|uniref:hypothetical protein n=1 Tax=unclassified Mesorhizobium TaxID=325217 RepID=UPI0011291550|nr:MULTISPECIES: hypothetical protein [unclassified Mesorhizobium]MBZ9703072.1 hypothetical protein [Mesorhizobium sp. CO1-1-3]MBZ9949826.1 hypothetical protein [Mesorhizobium sp. BR1-1-11]TPJ07650.1 hypothetical protein FJ428_04715 [Mesorhizobium sp. B2-8-1]